ncbi:MAG: penicillin-binding transpeptidase domain-containing protein, partial [Planctomycetota bacterium]|nr:penicillin-binding transpeptidase domain-containing protein [Planctomycetota bacterium]
GPVLATPLHMVRAMAAVANGGQLVEPHAVRAIGTRRTRFERRDLGLDPHHLARIRSGMYDVVNSGEGTARNAPWHAVPAEVSGKTGTAQVGKTWAPWDMDQDEEGPWHHWFVGFAEAPGRRTVAFACVLHSRTEAAAGMTAGPATARILAKWYESPRSKQLGATGR